MKIDKPQNSNYAAVVTSVKALVPLTNCDNLVGIPLFGQQAVVSKDTQIGTLGIMLPCESQLSEEFCRNNNLYRHANLNKDETQKGYIEDNCRIRAVKFRGNPSNCLFMPLDSLAYTGIDTSLLKEGDEFDTLNGYEICKKYVVPTREGRVPSLQEKKESRVDVKHMPEHFDTLHYMKYMNSIGENETVIITQKLHGTSIRIGHTIVSRRKTLGEKFARFFGVQTLGTEYAYVYGSRKVIKDANNPDQNHFYDTDVWTDQGKRLVGLLPKNYIVYAELIGWTGEKEIQRDYTYNLPKGECEMYIYRIANVNEDGFITELPWDAVKKFCTDNGLKHVPEMSRMKKWELDIGESLDNRYFEAGARNALYLGPNDLVDEGVCIRVENPVRIYKVKSPKFLEHETKILDTGEEDLESTQNV